VTEPSKESLQKVKQVSAKTGDLKSLSEADASILAVSLDLASAGGDVTLVTDDFAVRNVAEVLGVGLSETTVRGGEWKQITWITYCKGCGKKYSDPKATVCDVCGTKLSRKPKA
jgi:rRNA maturation endonuclease Nob1